MGWGVVKQPLDTSNTPYVLNKSVLPSFSVICDCDYRGSVEGKIKIKFRLYTYYINTNKKVCVYTYIGTLVRSYTSLDC